MDSRKRHEAETIQHLKLSTEVLLSASNRQQLCIVTNLLNQYLFHLKVKGGLMNTYNNK